MCNTSFNKHSSKLFINKHCVTIIIQIHFRIDTFGLANEYHVKLMVNVIIHFALPSIGVFLMGSSAKIPLGMLLTYMLLEIYVVGGSECT